MSGHSSRETLARLQADKRQRLADIAAIEPRLERAQDVLHRAIADEAEAGRILLGIKAQSLMEDEDGWRDQPAVIKAQADSQDAQERTSLARTVIADLEGQVGKLKDAAGAEERAIQRAVTALIRASDEVQAVIERAFYARRLLRQCEYILDETLKPHFPDGKIPNWENPRIFDGAPAAVANIPAWRNAVAALAHDADTPFPACPK